MRRRNFITGLASTTAAWSVVARAQQPMPVIGFLNGGSPDGYVPMLTTFRQALKDTGFVEGQNVGVAEKLGELALRHSFTVSEKRLRSVA